MLKIKINGKECYCEKEVFEYIVRTDEIKEGLQARLKLYEDNEKHLNKKIDKAIEYIETILIEKGKTKLELNSNEIGTLLNILKGE